MSRIDPEAEKMMCDIGKDILEIFSESAVQYGMVRPSWEEALVELEKSGKIFPKRGHGPDSYLRTRKHRSMLDSCRR
jgi:hypothetical protein